ncbi:hypothetical protein CNMCM6069_001269 [Aspergillus lentulus]|nr:hypothetical protein CNMCM6069_001269 [Aspergillus lentulus]
MIYGRLMYYSKRTCSIVGVVYWEFTYAAPAEFLNAPPCWLLIEKPEFWPKGIEDWTRGFDHRLKTFLRAMRACEDKAIQKGRLKEDQRLSGPMQQSWESGYSWIIYAVLHSFAFDAIYWQKIDPRFFGPTESPEEAWKDRLGLLDEKEKYEMEQLVARGAGRDENQGSGMGPDEYTVASRQQMKRRREEAKQERANADEPDEIDKVENSRVKEEKR